VKQLNVFCEGPTEQGFCKQVLEPHLFPSGGGLIHTLAVGETNHRHIYGLGRASYARLRKFILNTIKQRNREHVYFTTLIDLYQLPQGFPGKDSNRRIAADPTPYVMALEEAFKHDVERDVDCFRFIPYLQLHEYETLLFADPEAFGSTFENCEEAIKLLKMIAGSELSIEHINDGQETAPSKRIIKVIPEYRGRKSSAGPDIAQRIGLKKIREKCPHFDHWLSRLEQLLLPV
jgi:Domain of unknown function (DUF4276)